MDFEKIVKNYTDMMEQRLEKGLDKASQKMQKALEENSPYDAQNTGVHYKDSWETVSSPKRRRLHNTKYVTDSSGREIPLSNILEYGENRTGTAHIRKTYDSLEKELVKIIKTEMKG